MGKIAFSKQSDTVSMEAAKAVLSPVFMSSDVLALFTKLVKDNTTVSLYRCIS